MKAEKTIFFIIGILSILVFAGILLFSISEQGKTKESSQVLSYSKEATSRPKAIARSLFFDMGNMKVADEKTTEFMIENTGDKPLQLFNIASSCDCTFGQVAIGNIKSPEFSMHAKDKWVGEVKKGERATLVVIYRPQIMPVKGPVVREVYVSTNDPDNSKLTFTIKAFVE